MIYEIYNKIAIAKCTKIRSLQWFIPDVAASHYEKQRDDQDGGMGVILMDVARCDSEYSKVTQNVLMTKGLQVRLRSHEGFASAPEVTWKHKVLYGIIYEMGHSLQEFMAQTDQKNS